MKVLNVVVNLNKGGTQRAAQNFCEGYAALGHDSKMLAIQEGGIRKDELENENIQVWVGLSDKTLTEIETWKPDLVHLHSHLVTYDDIFSLKEICTKAKFVETNVFSIPSDYSNFLNYSYQLSNWCQYLYLARGGSKKICTKIPYPVKTGSFYKVDDHERQEFRKQYNIPEDAFLFGRVGQHFLGKWSLYLIDVFKEFNTKINSNSMLLVVNPPDELIKYVDHVEINSKVVIIGQLHGDDELRRCYSTIDVFLHIANQGESFGQVLAESLLCETPVITFNTPWGDNSQSEVVGDYIGGLCVNTLGAFYQKMKLLYSDAALRSKLAKGGRLHIITNFDYIAVSKASLNLISQKNSTLLHHASVPDFRLSKSYSKRSIPLLWMKMYLRNHKITNSLLRRLVNFELKNVN